jgi:hypothetical protein
MTTSDLDLILSDFIELTCLIYGFIEIGLVIVFIFGIRSTFDVIKSALSQSSFYLLIKWAKIFLEILINFLLFA